MHRHQKQECVRLELTVLNFITYASLFNSSLINPSAAKRMTANYWQTIWFILHTKELTKTNKICSVLIGCFARFLEIRVHRFSLAWGEKKSSYIRFSSKILKHLLKKRRHIYLKSKILNIFFLIPLDALFFWFEPLN